MGACYNKDMLAQAVRKVLEFLVKLYFKRHQQIKLIAITGSVGKTSAKLAIATILGVKYRVRFHQGNHNTLMSSPVAILGLEYPNNIQNPFSWLRVFSQALVKIFFDQTDIIIQELGTDRIDEIAQFGRYLKPDIAVVTAVAPEHMEYFLTLDNVAKEELAVTNFSRVTLLNQDTIDAKYLKFSKSNNVSRYSLYQTTDYRLDHLQYSSDKGYNFEYFGPSFTNGLAFSEVGLFGDHSLMAVTPAIAVAIKLGLSSSQIQTGLKKLSPVAGRMKPLKGLNNSLLIDDTYNSSPLAVTKAVQTLINLPATTYRRKIIVLGDMNELGETSKQEHQKIGELLFPKDFQLVITVGQQANQFIAPIAQANGCEIRTFINARQAGEFLKGYLKKQDIILFKGSESGIFLEEAVKIVLSSKQQITELVRQSEDWLAKKDKFFNQNN